MRREGAQRESQAASATTGLAEVAEGHLAVDLKVEGPPVAVTGHLELLGLLAAPCQFWVATAAVRLWQFDLAKGV